MVGTGIWAAQEVVGQEEVVGQVAVAFQPGFSVLF
jgi:hypothetical protein